MVKHRDKSAAPGSDELLNRILILALDILDERTSAVLQCLPEVRMISSCMEDRYVDLLKKEGYALCVPPHHDAR